jgi:hypothetical protein
MSSRSRLIIGFCSLILGLVAMAGITHPGYTDAFYYFNAAHQLATGQGLSDPAIWTYIGVVGGLPAPSHTYWMPFTSLLAAFSVGPHSFASSRWLFLLLYLLIPQIAFTAALPFGQRQAWFAALVTMLSGAFLPYWFTTDNFTPYAVIGAGALLAMAQARHTGKGQYFLGAGLLCGLAHLTRADGLLLLAVLWGAAAWRIPWRQAAWHMALGLAGYLAVMGWWFARNYGFTGALLPGGSFDLAFMRNYDEIMNYPPGIRLADFLAWGWPNILQSRWDAFLANLQTLVAVQGLILLAPFMLVGWWRARLTPLGSVFGLYAFILHTLMTVIFPFAGARGGLFHSAAALFPLWMAYAAHGFAIAIDWAAKKRRWRRGEAYAVFRAAVLLWAALFAYSVYAPRVASWGANPYGQFAFAGRPALVGDPAAYHYFTGGKAAPLPNAPPEMLPQIMARFGLEIIVVDADGTPGPLRSLWEEKALPPFLEELSFDGTYRVLILKPQ